METARYTRMTDEEEEKGKCKVRSVLGFFTRFIAWLKTS